MTQSQEQPPPSEVLRQGYEPDKVNVRGLVLFLILFLLTAVVLHAALWVLVKYYSTITRDVDVPKSSAPIVTRPPEPNLQPMPYHNQLPWQDMQQLKRHWASLFGQIGWQTDTRTGTAIIPDQIVSQLAQRYSTTLPATQNGGGQ